MLHTFLPGSLNVSSKSIWPVSQNSHFILFNRLAKQNIHVKYFGKLLAAFRQEGAAEAKLLPDDLNVVFSFADEALLDESLSKREREILILLVKRLSNKEIAEKLFI